jgi:hypothetical protein
MLRVSEHDTEVRQWDADSPINPKDGPRFVVSKATLDGCNTVGDVVKTLADAGDVRGAIMAARMSPTEE